MWKEAWEKGPEPNVLALSAAMNATGQGLRWDLSISLIRTAEQRSVALDAARHERFRADFRWFACVSTRFDVIFGFLCEF